MRAADIHVISWVGSERREHSAQGPAELQHHPNQDWQGWESLLGFDDQPAILKEALERGMEIWAIQHAHEDHSWLEELGMGHKVFRTFAEAVDAWLYYRGFDP